MKLTEEELALIQELRILNPARNVPSYAKATKGQLYADRVTKLLGSWPFLLAQSVILAMWVVFNIVAWVQHWDPYPFILLNLALWFQAAYAAPIILMSQNRESQIDREKLQYFYHVNLKSELELELLHHKLDELTALIKGK
ncbi:MAG: DUF1003 domain-containing protein [Dongiaceae bacterium]